MTSYINRENFILACQKELIHEPGFNNQKFDEVRKVQISLYYCACISDKLEEKLIIKKSYLDKKIYFSDDDLVSFLNSTEGSQATLECTRQALL